MEDQLYMAGLCLPFMAAAFFMLEGAIHQMLPAKLSVPCAFYALTGFYCPGCGGTRALRALLEGRFLLSFCYHPVVPYFGALYAWFMVSHTAERLISHLPAGGGGTILRGRQIGMAYRNVYLYIALALALLNVAVKDIALAAFHVDILKLIDSHVLIELF